MQATGDFKGQIGDASKRGLFTPEQRLAQLTVGMNPYVTGTSLPGDSAVFFGRQQALTQILGTLCQPDKPGCVCVLGERRIGKSTLLNQIYQALACEPNLVSIHASAQSWDQDSQQHFFTRLHACLAQTLGFKGGKQIKDYPDLRDFLLTQAQQGRRFVLMIDEFEIMAGNQAFDEYFFSNLRYLADRPEHRLAYVVSSRSPLKDLCDTHCIEASSFWNIFGTTAVLGLLAENDARDLIVKVFTQTLPTERQANWARLWEQDIRPLTGCHPALIQIAANAHWHARNGNYKLDELAVTMQLRDYLEDFWAKSSEDKALKAILLRAAAGQVVNSDYRTAELVQRGLLTDSGQPFSRFFGEVIVESLQGKAPLKVAKKCEREPLGVESFLQRWLPWLERFVKLWNDAKGKDKDKED